ncbi:glycosyltransferase family 9 protein [Candidatus Woesearchaeota archaeon]|nr:glycosyltransferase family 9 protein [Candidatus Woesearchaeota archaeon]
MGVRIIKFIDRYIGNVLCLILGLINLFRKKTPPDIKNILVIQFWGIGETILTLPAINALRLKFPKAKISILATQRNKDVYESFEGYNKLELIDLGVFSIIKFIINNHRKFDLVVDMEEYLNISAIIALFVGKKTVGYSHGVRSLLYTDKVKYDDKQHVSKTFLDLVKKLGIKSEVISLEKLKVSQKDRQVVEALLNKLKISKKDLIIGIAPGAAESAKSRIWSGNRFAKVADKLIEKYHAKVIFIGAGDERNLIGNVQDSMKNKSFNLAGRISLKQTFYLIEKCKLFISNDTGPMHMAAAQGIKTMGLFGPNLPVRFGPFGKKNISIYEGKVCEYSPCINVHKGRVPDCLFMKRSGNYQKCMNAIEVDDVMKAVSKLL